MIKTEITPDYRPFIKYGLPLTIIAVWAVLVLALVVYGISAVPGFNATTIPVPGIVAAVLMIIMLVLVGVWNDDVRVISKSTMIATGIAFTAMLAFAVISLITMISLVI